MSEPTRKENHMATQDFIAYYQGSTSAPGIDPTGAKVSIAYPHHEVHEGNFYTLSGTFTIAAGTANAYSIAIYPPANKGLHFQAVISAQNSGLAELYENPSFSGGGTVVPFNNKRNSSNLAGGTFVTNPTIATVGTFLQGRFIGANNPGTRIGGESNTRNEWILNPSYTYLVWFVADNADTKASVDIEFYVEDVIT